jgi:hypothetical protein
MTRQEAINRAIYYSLHSFSESDIRWQQRRSRKMTDDELRLAISEELGIAGGAAMAGLWYDYKGGCNPTIVLQKWPGMPPEQKPIIISGKALIASVRQILNIPEPSGQLSLFAGGAI